ncbi:hybrid sensor histidine kinase/response regulator transcription factor [Flammeovirga agarivorans]|uniref:histidine kinase n=1 Tax=Flammeovirga agarivorans TaxID=2726742 RepID=A0A7X8XXM4_9BACT|nr:two-component regulator propeller domain-containing protein [Flammeovirga agarivorans]NLR93377.1 response regulator [Flammeovirga agarivorans]
MELLSLKTKALLRIFLFVVGACLQGTISYAINKDIVFSHYTTKQGLSQNDVNCIFQDKSGLMWIGTNDGFSRFDGYEFKNYRMDTHGLPSNLINSICEDNYGNLWIGSTDAGLFRFNLETEKFSFFANTKTSPKLITHNNITNLVKDPSGNLWFGNSKGLNKVLHQHINDEKIVVEKFYHNPHNHESILSNYITNLFVDHYGNLWVGSKRGIQLLINPDEKGQYSIFKRFNKSEENSVLSVIEGQNCLLVSYFDGIYQLKVKGIGDSKGEFKKVSDIKSECLLSDDNGIIWAGTSDGLYQLKFDDMRNSLDVIGYQNSHNNQFVNSNIITALYKDQLGVIWIGTNGSGINKYNPRRKKFRHIKKGERSSDLTYNKIRGVYQDEFDRIWIGTEGAGINVIDNNEIKEINVAPNKKSQNVVYAIDQFQDQLIFGIGYPLKTLAIDIKEALQLNVKSSKYVLHPDTHSNSTFDVQNDGDSILWLATYGGGLIRGHLEGKKMVWSYPEILDNDDDRIEIIRSLMIDSHGNLWVGTNQGVVFVSREEKNKEKPRFQVIQHIDDDNSSLSYNYVLPIFEASNGQIWIGTMGGGLNIYEPKKSDIQHITFSKLSTNDGLPSNVIKSILEDDYGNLWVASNKGLSKINLENRSIKNFDVTDGLQDDEFGELSAFKLNNGELLFGGVNGINIFKPHEIIDDNTIANVIFTQLKVLNKEIHTYDEFDGNLILKAALQNTKAIELHHDQNSFSVKFASLHYGASENNHYKYKLVGFDDNWIVADVEQREAKYTNLSPGEYTLLVKASNADNIWNPNPIELKVTVLPPWWMSWWAKIIYFGILVAAIFFFSRYSIITARKKSQLEMEKFEREKLEDLSQLKLQFFTNISHELRTPLTLIHTPIEQLIKKGSLLSASEREKSYQLIFKNVEHLMRLVNQLLDFRKVEQGQMKLQLSRGNWSTFIEQVYYSFKEFAEHENIAFVIERPENDIHGFMDHDKLEKILYNLLSNAFKFTYNGEIKLSITQKDNKAVIQLKDTGIGISAEKLDYLFNRFYQVSNLKTAKNRGTGIGLAFTKSLVDLHHGTINVESTVNIGTTFTLEFPLERDAFSPEEIVDLAPVATNEEEQNAQEEDELDVSAKQKILVIDDNHSIRDLLKGLLEDDYEVYTAEDGQKGLQKAKEVMPNLVLSDIMMPIMDGYELTKSIRDDDQLCHLPIILLTAKNSEDSKLKGYEYGVDAYVTKPFNSDVLLARIHALIENRKNQQKKFRTKVDVTPSEITFTSIDEKFLKKLVSIVEENISDSEFTVDKLATEYGATPIRLNQKLKALTGQTAKGFIRNIRLKRAAQMLKLGRYSVSDVTYEVGFNDLKYFRNCFKKEFGIPPSTYLKEASEENNSISMENIELQD